VRSGGPERPDIAGLGGGAIGVGRRGVDERADKLSHPVFKPKLNAHSMCAQESSLHTYRTENGDRITNASI
jgi:hypothetical protein